MWGKIQLTNTTTDPFFYTEFFEEKIAGVVGEAEDWEDRRVPDKTQEARKLFCASLFDTMNRENDRYKVASIGEAFFSTSPSFASYCGGLKDNLELLSIAERSINNNRSKSVLCGEIIYDYSFSDFNGFDEVLKQASPTKQLQLLPVIYDISEQCWPDDWNGGVLNKVSEALGDLANSQDATPLVVLAAESFSRQIDSRINAEWVDIDMNNPEHVELVRRNEEWRAKRQLEQNKIHSEYPKLPVDSYSVMVAPGVAGAFTKGRLNLIIDKNGKHGSLLEYNEENDFGINRDMAELIGAAHTPGVKELIDAKLGVDLAKIPLDAQTQLLKFMTEAGNARFDKLCETMQLVDEKLRPKLANSFLAADFGEDFGDGLLDIANSERISSEQLGEILDGIESCRESIRGITGLYKGIDGGKFASEYARASNERLTDALMVFRQIATRGSAEAELGWFGGADFDFDKAMEALNYEVKSLKIINGTLEDVSNGVKGAFAETVLPPAYYSNFSLYNFYSPKHGYVLLYTRPEGSGTFDETIEYGKYRSKYDTSNNNAGVEASISMIVDPVNPFSLPRPYKPDRKKVRDASYYDPYTMNKVSALRLDREGRAPDAPVDDPNRNPMNNIGTVSVDLAAINDRADTPSGKIARLFSVGNKLRESSAGTDFTLNHNTHWFEQDKYGTADGFKKLVGYIDSLMTGWCAEHKPGKDAESYRKLMKAFRRKTGRAVA